MKRKITPKKKTTRNDKAFLWASSGQAKFRTKTGMIIGEIDDEANLLIVDQVLDRDDAIRLAAWIKEWFQ